MRVIKVHASVKNTPYVKMDRGALNLVAPHMLVVRTREGLIRLLNEIKYHHALAPVTLKGGVQYEIERIFPNIELYGLSSQMLFYSDRLRLMGWPLSPQQSTPLGTVFYDTERYRLFEKGKTGIYLMYRPDLYYVAQANILKNRELARGFIEKHAESQLEFLLYLKNRLEKGHDPWPFTTTLTEVKEEINKMSRTLHQHLKNPDLLLYYQTLKEMKLARAPKEIPKLLSIKDRNVIVVNYNGGVLVGDISKVI